jgi:hypothetical protein
MCLIIKLKSVIVLKVKDKCVFRSKEENVLLVVCEYAAELCVCCIIKSWNEYGKCECAEYLECECVYEMEEKEEVNWCQLCAGISYIKWMCFKYKSSKFAFRNKEMSYLKKKCVHKWGCECMGRLMYLIKGARLYICVCFIKWNL